MRVTFGKGSSGSKRGVTIEGVRRVQAMSHRRRQQNRWRHFVSSAFAALPTRARR